MDLDFIPTNQGYTSTKTNMEYMSRGVTFSQTIILGIHVQLKFALSKVVNPQLKADSPWKHKQLLQRIYSGRNRTPTTDSSEEYHYSLPKIRELSEPQRFQDSEAPTYSNSVGDALTIPKFHEIPEESKSDVEQKKEKKKRAQIPPPNLPPLLPGTNPSSFGTPFQPPKNTGFSTAPGPLGWKRISPVKVARMHKMESTKTLKETSGWLLGFGARGPRAASR